MDKIDTNDVICGVTSAMFSANSELQESPADKFNRNLLQLITQEIEKAKPAAMYWKYICPGSREYTYTGTFPLSIYEVLSEDFLIQLESTGVYIFKNNGLNTANIRITFHFWLLRGSNWFSRGPAYLLFSYYSIWYCW